VEAAMGCGTGDGVASLQLPLDGALSASLTASCDETISPLFISLEKGKKNLRERTQLRATVNCRDYCQGERGSLEEVSTRKT